MAHSLDELLQLAAEGDEEAQAEIKARFEAVERDKAAVARDLKLKTDPTLRDRYPRALRAWDKGKLRLADSISESELLDALRDKEEEYAELGVPVDVTAPPQPATETVSEPSADDPAKALSGVRGAGSPGGQPRDLVGEFFNNLKGTTQHDTARAFAMLPELNKMGEEGKAKIKQITRQLEARPIQSDGL